MKILVYGHKGWIGGQFILLLENTQYDYILGTERVDNTPLLIQEIYTVKPTHIVSFIGRTHGTIDDIEYTTIDYLEQPGKLVENIKDNLFSPISLALLCKERNIHYTYLGTGCIFNYIDNNRDKGFSESDIPNFFGSGYSVVKGFTDRLMHQFKDTVLNLRIRMPIVDKDCPRNFITKIANYEKICSVPNSMSVLPELLPIALKMMEKGVVGTINLTNPGVISHNEILEMYKEYVDKSFSWNNFSIEEQRKVIACDRSNNLLDTTKLENFAPEVRHIKDAVRELLKNYEKNPTIVPVCCHPINVPYELVPPNYRKKNIITKNEEISDIKTNSQSDFTDLPSTVLFVTGGAGFIGSNFINEIYNIYKNIKIINFDALYYCADEIKNINEEIRNDKDRYTFKFGNLQSLDLLNYIFQTNKITHVIHFAAQSHVQGSFTDAIQYTKDNILGTHNLLETVRSNCTTLQKFIHVSTDEVYGESMLNINENCKNEQSVLCPTNPYAATKAGAELLAQSYNHSFKMPIIITRGNNVYGPNQYPEKVIPKFIQKLQRDEKITIQGDGSCVRAFLHSYDTSTAFITILEKGNLGEIYNIGCDEGMEYSILDLAKMLIKKIKGTDDYSKWITFIEDRPFNDKRYYISNNKLKDLGWSININFEDGINGLI
uniref:NAD(P)-binding domain-containing protein n=1 Tax=viral metagenome TaxID=1070528 RepID=A0A6C0HQ87_9ZZZZ